MKIKKQYHVHLTLATRDVELPKGWKKTTIVLVNKQVQTDVMLTRHFVLGRGGVSTLEGVHEHIKKLGLKNLVRVKVEQEEGFDQPISFNHYVEIHALCPQQEKPPKEWVVSKNPKNVDHDVKHYFLTKRFYEGASILDVEAQAREELLDARPIEVRVEQVMCDSNRDHDAWWVNEMKSS
jgi:hypothetical protein